jgi:hypothetical protein
LYLPDCIPHLCCLLKLQVFGVLVDRVFQLFQFPRSQVPNLEVGIFGRVCRYIFADLTSFAHHVMIDQVRLLASGLSTIPILLIRSREVLTSVRPEPFDAAQESPVEGRVCFDWLSTNASNIKWPDQ